MSSPEQSARSDLVWSRSIQETVEAFLSAFHTQDRTAALQLLKTEPRIADESLHVAAALGVSATARRLIEADPASVRVRIGAFGADPLLCLCYSPFHGESEERDKGLLETARVLIDAGADPNTRDAHYGVPALYAVTGVRSVLPIARLLLDAGANPTDGESVCHAAERFHVDALELLLDSGADLNYTGEWGNTPLYFLLRWRDVEQEPTVRQGLRWLLDHGADPNVLCGPDREGSLHVAARRGQNADVIQMLLNHGADVHLRRGDGRTPWMLAMRGGFDEIASMLEDAGATRETLSESDLLLSACSRGDAEASRRLALPAVLDALAPSDRMLLPEAASDGRSATVAACLAAGFDVNATDTIGAMALHHAAINGNAALVRALIDAGADIHTKDSEHSSSPLGWACFGADHVANSDGDYEGCVRLLLDAGAKPSTDEHQPQHVGISTLLRSER